MNEDPGWIITLWVATAFALIAFVAALIRLLTLSVAQTLGGRAAIFLLISSILLALVGVVRRLGWEWWVEAQAVAWLIAGSAALGAAFTRSGKHAHHCRDDVTRKCRP